MCNLPAALWLIFQLGPSPEWRVKLYANNNNDGSVQCKANDEWEGGPRAILNIGIGKKPLNNEKESGRGWTTKPVNRKLCQRKRSTETKDGVITGWTLFSRLDMVPIKAAWVGVVFEWLSCTFVYFISPLESIRQTSSFDPVNSNELCCSFLCVPVY